MSKIPGGTYGILASGQSIYDYSATPCCAVGTRLPMGDRVFYYGMVSTTVARGDLLAPDSTDGGPWVLAVDGSCVAITAANSIFGKEIGEPDKAIPAAMAVGQRRIGITHADKLDGIIAHQLKDGYIFLNDTGGVQQVYKIKDNGAHSGVTTDVVEILLYDEVRAVTVDSTCSVCLMQNGYMNLALCDSAVDEGFVSGVAMAPGTTTYPYIWVQTWGPSVVSSHTSTAHAGTNMVLSTTAGKATIESTGDILPVIGWGICDVATAGDGAPIDLRIRP